jgi:hypothetical protein
LDRRLGGSRAGLDDVEKRKFLILSELELRPLRLPACSQSLYRLSYPDSSFPLGSMLNSGSDMKAVLSAGRMMTDRRKPGYVEITHPTCSFQEHLT